MNAILLEKKLRNHLFGGQVVIINDTAAGTKRDVMVLDLK